MNEFEEKIFNIVKDHRKERKYLVKGTTIDNPSWFPLKSIWFSEIFKILFPDLDPKKNVEKKQEVKKTLLKLEQEKKIDYGVGEPPFYILYEDRDKLKT